LIYRFGDHTLDTESLRLTANGEKIAVEPQVFSLLQYLVEHRDRVVSKDEIIEHVWDGRIVSDGTLTSRINSVRRAVRDDGKSQAVIKTFPRRGIRFVAAVTEDSVSEATPPLPDKPSIAVLPFENRSDDPQQEYFSDGMAEDLITDISNISGVFVIARNSSFAFKGHAIDVKEIAKKLGVKHIVEGSVRKMRDKLRVNVQLIDAASGGHLWAARYDGDMEDIFQFQDDIREQIVSALKVSLPPTDKALTERKPTNSVEAYDLFLKGRANYHAFGPKHLIEAIKCFERAIEIDPKFDDVYGYLSYCHFLGWANFFPDFDNSMERALDLAERGVALDGSSATALTSLGWMQTILHRYDQSIANFEKAIALAPDNAVNYTFFGQALNFWGDPERGLTTLEKAFDLETNYPGNWEFQLAHSLLLLRQYDEAVTRLNRAVERIPKSYIPLVMLAWVYAELDRLDDARDAMKKALEIAPRFSVQQAIEKWPYRIDEDRTRFLDALRKGGLPEG
jgi:TolB-like protein